jgi:hypothetical protein
VSALKYCGFQGSNQGIVMVAIYVDDCLIIGDDSKINEVIEELKGYNFVLKVEDHLTDYRSC